MWVPQPHAQSTATAKSASNSNSELCSSPSPSSAGATPTPPPPPPPPPPPQQQPRARFSHVTVPSLLSPSAAGASSPSTPLSVTSAGGYSYTSSSNPDTPAGTPYAASAYPLSRTTSRSSSSILTIPGSSNSTPALTLPPILPPPSSPTSGSGSAANNNNNPLTTLTLLHLFTTRTSLALSTRPAVHKIWQSHIPRLAISLAAGASAPSPSASSPAHHPPQSYLLHALLSVAALHKASLARPRRRRRWLVVASEEHQRTLGGFRAAVARYAERGVGEWMQGDEGGGGGGSGEFEEGIGQAQRGKRKREEEEEEGRGNGNSNNKHRVEDEMEAVFMASALLCIYGCSITTAGMCLEHLDSLPHTSSPHYAHNPPLLSWLPLVRGTPAMIRFSPLGWVLFSQGALAALSTAIDSVVTNHPYTAPLRTLGTLFASHPLHPGLPAPTLPLTRGVWDGVLAALELAFERFFSWGDPVAAGLSFPATVEDPFIIALLGRGGGGGAGGGGGGGTEGGGKGRGDRDPRALVVMAHFMVLMVLLGYVLPGEKEVEVEDWEADWDGREDGEDEVHEDEDAVVAVDEREDAEGDAPGIKLSRARGWWLAGIGKREIRDIAAYLADVDAEERRLDRMGAQGGELAEAGVGRWTRWMRWPIEMARGDRAAREAHAFRP